ncbi:MAG: integrin [Deltaproteobacteria bacterium]|nr:integrin [Deltaproteobacteria bacterium]
MIDSDALAACGSDSECDDGVFCNGSERCIPDDPRASLGGCVPADAPCTDGQRCDEATASCQTMCDVSGDADGDGYDSVDCGGDDCDDAKASVNPEAVEVCDGEDNDCDGLDDVAEGVCPPCAAGYRLLDGSCVNVDECTEGAPCGDAMVVTACMDLPGSFRCRCVSGFAATAAGQSCLYADPSLRSLEPSAAVLSPTFSPGLRTYRLTLPAGLTSVTLTPSVAYPDRAAIRVNGDLVASGTPSAPLTLTDFAPMPVRTSVLTEAGATRAYSVLMSRGSSYLKASNTGAGDEFGWAVALSADGSTLAIGAEYEASNASGVDGDQANDSLRGAGAVYIFTRTGSEWSQQAYLKASNPSRLQHFGDRLSLSADGSTLAVGAWAEPSSAVGVGGDQTNRDLVLAGAAYVFTRSGTMWTQQAYIKASNTGSGDRFGCAVALSTDGSTLAVGAWGESSSATGAGGDQADDSAWAAGAVYVFTRTGVTWTQQAYLKASNPEVRDRFGVALSLSADGSTLAVGASGEDSSATGLNGDQADNTVSLAGAVYVFTRMDTRWTQQAYLKASNTDRDDNFGRGLALSADGSTLAVGARYEDSNATGIDGDQWSEDTYDAGAVYVFTRAGAIWSQQAYVKASNTGSSNYFGRSLALSSDGSTLAIGSEGESSSATGIGGDEADDSVSDAGAVYVFARSGTSWAQVAYVKASNTSASDMFGFTLALSRDASTLAVSAYQESSNATGVDGIQADNSALRAGAVYVF